MARSRGTNTETSSLLSAPRPVVVLPVKCHKLTVEARPPLNFSYVRSLFFSFFPQHGCRGRAIQTKLVLKRRLERIIVVAPFIQPTKENRFFPFFSFRLDRPIAVRALQLPVSQPSGRRLFDSSLHRPAARRPVDVAFYRPPRKNCAHLAGGPRIRPWIEAEGRIEGLRRGPEPPMVPRPSRISPLSASRPPAGGSPVPYYRPSPYQQTAVRRSRPRSANFARLMPRIAEPNRDVRGAPKNTALVH